MLKTLLSFTLLSRNFWDCRFGGGDNNLSVITTLSKCTLKTLDFAACNINNPAGLVTETELHDQHSEIMFMLCLNFSVMLIRHNITRLEEIARTEGRTNSIFPPGIIAMSGDFHTYVWGQEHLNYQNTAVDGPFVTDLPCCNPWIFVYTITPIF